MTYTRYHQGRKREYAIINKLRELGKFDIIVRTARSHSPIDIIAISFSERRIKFIQSKINVTESQKRRLLNQYHLLNGIFNGDFEVI